MPRRPEQSDLWEAPHPSGFAIPSWAVRPADGEVPRACRSCSAEVLWVETQAGRRAPLNRDGTSHFSTCPQADEWRNRKVGAR